MMKKDETVPVMGVGEVPIVSLEEPTALAQLPPATLAQLPPATLAQLPPATLAQLPPATLAQLPPVVQAQLPPAVQAQLPPAVQETWYCNSSPIRLDANDQTECYPNPDHPADCWWVGKGGPCGGRDRWSPIQLLSPSTQAWTFKTHPTRNKPINAHFWQSSRKKLMDL